MDYRPWMAYIQLDYLDQSKTQYSQLSPLIQEVKIVTEMINQRPNTRNNGATGTNNDPTFGSMVKMTTCLPWLFILVVSSVGVINMRSILLGFL